MVGTATDFRGRYLSVTSYRRDGTAVATPVWFVEQDGRLLVQTELGSGKVKRLRANPLVTVAICNGMGHLRGEAFHGRAEVLDDNETARIEDLIRRKYHWDMMIFGPLRWVQRTVHLGKDRGPTVGLAITLDAPE